MITLSAKPRTETGKKAKMIRSRGAIPAVVYGAKTPAESIEVNEREFEKIWRLAGEAGLVELVVDGSTKNVLIKDVQRDPLKAAPLHIDFYVVQMDQLIRAKVPVKFTGEAPAVKQGAILVKIIHELEVEALPANLPHEVNVDISKFANAGDRFLVSDLVMPAGVTVIADSTDIVVLTEAPRAEEEVAAETAPTIADIEVVDKKGKEEEETPESATETK